MANISGTLTPKDSIITTVIYSLKDNLLGWPIEICMSNECFCVCADEEVLIC